MTNLNTIKNGQRFNINATEFEICDVSSGNIRYANVIGGKMNFITIKKFEHLINNKVIKDFQNNDDVLPDQLNETEVTEMNRRLTYLRTIIAKTNNHVSRKEVPPILNKIAATINDIKKPSFATYARWHKAFISSNKNPLSVVSESKKRGNRCIKFDPIIEHIISKHIRKDWLKGEKPTIAAVYANITGAIIEQYSIGDTLPDDVKFPTLKVISKRIDDIDPFIKDKHRQGKYFANRKYRAAGKGILPTRILEIVQADGNYIDVLIIDEVTKEVIGRAYLTIIIDVYSRCIIAYKISFIPFSSATLLSTMKTAVVGEQTGHGGVFEIIIVDNGSDYISTSVKCFCNHLGINMEHGAPKEPNTKAHVERIFRTINTQVIHLIPGTTFSNNTERGEYKSEKYACMTLNELDDLLSDWIKTIYHKSIHGGTGRAPELLWADSEKSNPVHTYQEKHLDTIAREVVTKKVSNGRIRHMYLYWYSHALATVEEKLRQQGLNAEVEVYVDTLNLKRLYVKDPDTHGGYITCDSTNPEYTNNLSMYEHKLVIAELKEQSKKDIAHYPNKHLEIAKYKLWKRIVQKGDKHARKQIARIKDTHKENTHSISDMQKELSVNNKKNATKTLAEQQVDRLTDCLNAQELCEVLPDDTTGNLIDNSTSFGYERI